MIISTKDWLNYISKMRKLNNIAAEKMQEYVRKNGFGDTQAIIDYAYALITKYGEGSAELACQMYDAIAEMQGASVPLAVPAPTSTYGDVAKAINGSLLQSPAGNKLDQVVGRHVKLSGADTMLKNAIRDGAEFAWVPFGDTCAFCITLASRGWQKISKKALKKGHAEHIHANCDCQYCVRFDGKSDVEGYDPDVYKKMYYGAEGDTPSERINTLRRELEESRKHRVFEHENAIVNMDYVKSNEFRRKLDTVVDSVTERRGIERSIEEMLDHRSGTYYEDLAYINSNNGKYLINKDFDFYDEKNRISACKPSHSMNAYIGEQPDYTIIGVHNHPQSNAPSIKDIKAAYERKYKYGIVSCHNGKVYKYVVDKSFSNTTKNRRFCNMLLEDLDRAVYTKDAAGIAQALADLAESGIKIEVV